EEARVSAAVCAPNCGEVERSRFAVWVIVSLVARVRSTGGVSRHARIACAEPWGGGFGPHGARDIRVALLPPDQHLDCREGRLARPLARARPRCTIYSRTNRPDADGAHGETHVANVAGRPCLLPLSAVPTGHQTRIE